MYRYSPSQFTELPLSVRPVRTPEDLRIAQRFRYQVCIEEYGQTYLEGIDHPSKTLGDHLDHDLTVFGVYAQNQLVGTVRWGLLSWTKRPHRHSKAIQRLGFDIPEMIGMTDRLALAPQVRNLATLRLLTKTIGTHALFAGSAYEFCWAQPRLTPLYTRLGYRKTSAEVLNDAGQKLHIMQLNLRQPNDAYAYYPRTHNSPKRPQHAA